METGIDRVKQDLELIASAAGFGDPPLRGSDVSANLAFGVFGLFFAAASWLAGGFSYIAMTWILLIACLVAVIVGPIVQRRIGPSTAASARADRWTFRIAWILGCLIDGFYSWAKFLAHLTGAPLLGAVLLFSGGLLALLAATDPWRLSFLGWAVSLILFGLFVPSIPGAMMSASVGAVIAAGGFAGAAITHIQLRLFRSAAGTAR